jgi:hypothetical protein
MHMYFSFFNTKFKCKIKMSFFHVEYVEHGIDEREYNCTYRVVLKFVRLCLMQPPHF